jgi:hypothetical protein
VHDISPTEVIEKVIPPIDVSSTSYSTEIACYQNAYVNDIKAQLEENSHKINYLREVLNANVDAIKAITKHCVMMNSQVKQMVSLQNKLYGQLISKEKHVCGVNIQEEVQLLRILIFLKATQREKRKRLSKLVNILQENIPMEINLKSVIKIKNKIPLFFMVKLKMEMIMGKNHLKLTKTDKKKMNLIQEMILNLQRRRKKEISTKKR